MPRRTVVDTAEATTRENQRGAGSTPAVAAILSDAPSTSMDTTRSPTRSPAPRLR